MKKILITGAAGFIGFHLSQKLKSRGDSPVGIDNFNDYYDPALKRRRASVLKECGVDVVEGDICDSETLKRVFEEHGCTQVVHLAAQAGVRYSLENPRSYVHSNLQGFVEVLELARNHPGTSLVYASSSSVYGLNEKTPFSVDDVCDRPASLYGATKKANELLAHSYHHLYQIPCIGLRFFTVYGPWGRPDMAYYSFAEAIEEGRPIKVFNQGQMERDFTYIDDIVDGVVAAIDRNMGACEVFNLGNNKSETLLDFIAYIEKALGKKARKEFLPMQAGDVERTFADIEASKELLGFQPQVSLAEGIERFVDWFQNCKIS